MPDRFRQSLHRRRSASLFLFLIALFTSGLRAEKVEFTGDDAFEARKNENGGKPRENSSDGTVKLAWGSPNIAISLEKNEAVFELQQAKTEAFSDPVIRYRGTDFESFQSGLPEGVHWFRVRPDGGDWSIPIAVEVTFIDRTQLFLLLGTGFAVAALTAAAILFGHFKNRPDTD